MTSPNSTTETGQISGDQPVETRLDRAQRALRDGAPILVHDAAEREGETDLIYPAEAVDAGALSRLRNDAGGLVCVALSHSVAERFELPFMADAVDHPAVGDHDLAYDDRSSFSLPVNHRETYTGITDQDRAKTIQALGEAAAAPETTDFASEFRIPGHVHLLRGAPDLLDDRKGHTELALALVRSAELPPAVVVCEMLDGRTGEALSPVKASAYAARHDLPFLEGQTVLNGLNH